MLAGPVLVVEDNALNMKLVTLVLGGAGIETVEAVDAKEALAALERLTPSLILMDLQLPDHDGIALTRQLKDNPRFASLPIVAVSGFSMQRDEAEALAAGCCAFMAKPIDNDGLVDLVRRFALEA